MNRQRVSIALIFALLAAVALRFWGLGDVPPGLSHDEVANWLIAQDVLDGHHAIYFTAAYGHEPLYQYVQAATVALFGDNWLGLRWPSVAFGLLGIAATYTLIRYLFGVPVALLTTGWLAISFWPLFYSRVAYRAILLPFTAALSAYFLFRVIGQPNERASESPRRWSSDALLAGLCLGLSIYTYMAARILPFILATVVVYAKLARPREPMPWSRVLLVFLIAALVSAPLLFWLRAHPDAEYRIGEVRQPLDRLLAGDPSLAWRNLVANLKFFTLAGDPWPRYNLPGRPVFAEPVGGALFVAGLLIALWRWRDCRYGFLIIWLIGSLGPSVVTSDPPSSIRNILGLVVTFVFPALPLVEAGRWARSQLSARRAPVPNSLSWLARLLPVLGLMPALILTTRDYFIQWPRNDVVRFDYQADLTAVAKYLEELPPEASVTVSGLSVDTMDGPTLRLASRSEVDSVRLCDTREALIVPSSLSADIWVLIPQIVPLDEILHEQLMNWGAMETQKPSFTIYHLFNHAGLRQDLAGSEKAVATPDGTSTTLPVSFGGHLALLGYRQLRRTGSSDPLILLTYWRVEDPPPTQLKVFVHLTNTSGELIAQDDGLTSPSERWHANDIMLQKHVLSLPEYPSSSGLDSLRVGVYEESTENRLPVLASDHLRLLHKARK